MQAALLLFGLMATAALIVDLGIARVTQGGMKVAADSASLAGLRSRDAFTGTPAEIDLARRAVASQTAASLFDDDFNLATANSALLLGAGPQLATGVGGVNDPAGGLLTSDGPYLPRLELNAAANDQAGDLVAGAFLSNPGVANWHAESARYGRGDFVASSAADSSNASAFLVRLRRSHDPLDLDNQPGISSAGSSLPFLFGLGSPLGATDPETYDPRRDGLTVRATSIAEARPALAAGLSRAGLSGLIPIGADGASPGLERIVAFEDASWRTSVAAGAVFAVVVSSDGGILGDATSPDLQGFASSARGLVRVGDLVAVTPSPGSVSLAAESSAMLGVRYFALYADLAGAIRITGFAGVQVDSAVLSTDGAGQPTWTLTGRKIPDLVAPENASAVPALASDFRALLPPSPDRGALLAPVLVR